MTNTEYFYWEPSWMGKSFVTNKDKYYINGLIAKDCYNLSKDQCLNYSNCGISVNNYNTYKCLPGDDQGPYFSEGEDYWIYNNTDRHVFGETNIKKTRPYDFKYGDFDVYWPSPVASIGVLGN